MDYPPSHVGHHSHHSNRRHDDYNDDDNPPPPPPFSHSPYPPPPHHDPSYPPPPSYGGAYDSHPPPHGGAYDSHPPPHGGAYDTPPPPHGGAYESPPPHGGAYDAPPPHHGGGYESHGGAYGAPPPPEHSYEHQSSTHHRFQPHMPGFIGSHFHHGGSEEHSSSTHGYDGPGGPETGLGSLENKPSYRIECKAGGERYAVGVRDDKVVLTHPNSADITQHWCKDERYSTKVKDKDGYPSFILVNKGTAQAVKHSISCHPVQLAPYRPDVFDESVLWTQGKDLGSGFRSIRTVNNVRLVMDAWNADKDHGGIHDGTFIALYETWKGDNQNQQWKFIRH
ncbi:hypothetical protein RND81_07G110500 [Saponaria officinalis]|uniref:Uncharacterized protein n=1 Tax=Saponaria officinalis TaxID=3572 RepID=A0AAW1JP96_SAPOF